MKKHDDKLFVSYERAKELVKDTGILIANSERGAVIVGVIKKEKNPYPCDSCLVGWCAISNQETKSCQDTCIMWKEYWKRFKI